MNLAVIPARGGSKRIPQKNIKSFLDKPIIAYSIETAKNSRLFDRIVVSTDDPEIKAIALEYGAEVPFIRPEALANDTAGTLPVIAHAIQFFAEQHHVFDYVCCLYATAPLLSVEDLCAGWTVLKQNPDVLYTFSAAEFDYPIWRSFALDAQGRAQMFFPEFYASRSQDLPKAYHDAGQFYLGRPQAFLQELTVFAPHAKPIILPKHRVQDIDDMEDWHRAEHLYLALADRLK